MEVSDNEDSPWDINEEYEAGFIRQIDASQRGEVVSIPHPLDRVGEVFNIMPSRYTFIFGATGSGKTSYMDYTYILAPWSYLQKHELDIHWEINYFSLERKKMFKHAKWVSWMMYRDNTELLVSADQIMGWQGGPMNTVGYNLVRQYDQEMSNLLDHVNIYDGKVNVKVIERKIFERAYELGTFFRADERGVRMDDQLIYIKEFSTDGIEEITKKGEKKIYIQLEWEGTTFKIYPDKHRYFAKHPRTFVFFLIDGINLLGSKDVIDDISVVLSNARDLFGFAPVVVSQQNRAMGDITRTKIHGADLSPQIEDAFKSSQMGFDADLIIGLFDPVRYKAWDKEGNYGGYHINPDSNSIGSMQSPSGINRFRSMHILKNTFGADGLVIGMKFLGECNHFSTLPFPDTIELENVYSDIRRGL